MLKALIFAPILFVLVLFALSNPQPVRLGLWPTDLFVDIPLSITILLAMAVAFLLGALLIWFSAVGARLRARRAEHAVRMLEAQVAELKARSAVRPAEPQVLAPSGSRPATQGLPAPGHNQGVSAQNGMALPPPV